MSEKAYSGGCHCGKVRYEVTTAMQPLISCNCSICSKRGALLTFVSPDKMKLEKGQPNELTDYQFNKHVIHHLFCPTCGVASYPTGKMPDGSPMFAINVRCLDNVDLEALEPTKFDGKSR